MNTHQQKQAQRSATISKAQRKAREQGNQRTQLIRTILFFNRKGVDYRQHRKILTLTARQGNMFGDSQCSAHTYAWLAMRRNWKTMQQRNSFCTCTKTQPCSVIGKPCKALNKRRAIAKRVFWQAYQRASNGF